MKSILAFALITTSVSSYALMPSAKDLDAARTSFAIEAGIEGCWIYKEVPVPCEGEKKPGPRCISIQIKKVPCKDEEEKKPVPVDNSTGA